MCATSIHVQRISMKQTTFASAAWGPEGSGRGPRGFFGRDGSKNPLGIDSGTGRAALPEGGQRHPADADGADAADLLYAAVVQPVGPCDGRLALRLGVDAPLRPDRAAR